jgi:hypothetical protein
MGWASLVEKYDQPRFIWILAVSFWIGLNLLSALIHILSKTVCGLDFGPVRLKMQDWFGWEWMHVHECIAGL